MRINGIRVLFLTLAAAWIGLGGAGRAADVPSMFVKAKPAAVVDPWQGFYFGPHIGYGWSHEKYVNNFPVFDGETDADVHADGVLGGFQLGYNFQFNHLLLGVEGDFTWSGMKNEDFSCYPFGDQLCTAKPQLFADIAGRLGYIEGPWLVYAKGGAAFVQDRYENFATCAGSQPRRHGGVSADCGVKYFADTARPGWLIGGGIETFIARNWSVKLEYNYMDFGSPSITFKDGNSGFFTEEIHQQVHVVKAGLNYHFGGSDQRTAGGLLSYAATGNHENDGNHNGNGDNGTNTVAAFFGLDLAKETYGTYVGALMSPFGNLDESGFRLYIIGDGGYYRYPIDTGKIAGYTSGGSLLGGWGFEGETYSIDLLVGPNAINHTLTSIDLENDVQGTAFGVMGRADMHFNPTPQWLIAAEGDYSTAFGTFESLAKLGYEIIPNSRVYFGPEGGANGDRHSHQWRVGGHISEIRFLGLQIDIGAGYADDSDNGPGAYGRMEISRTF